MSTIATAIMSWSTLLKLVVGALVAGLGVTVAFSLLIFCADRATTLRRTDQRAAAIAFQAASVLALLAVLAIVAYGLILTISKK
jgi:hypothetical protein